MRQETLNEKQRTVFIVPASWNDPYMLVWDMAFDFSPASVLLVAKLELAAVLDGDVLGRDEL